MSLTHNAIPRQPSFRGEAVPVVQVETPKLGMLFGAGQHVRPTDGARRFDFCALDLDDSAFPLTLIPMDFFGHGISPNPIHPEIVAVFEKRGAGACEINLKQGVVTRSITTTPDRRFYGHGAYSPDGRFLYCTETIVEDHYEGVIAVRDAGTHQILGEFSSFGASPHDCRLINDGNTLVVTNGGGPAEGTPPSVTYVDVQTATLIEKFEFDTPDINAGHLDLTGEGRLAVVSAPREGLAETALGGITLKLADGRLHTLTEPAEVVRRLSGETLSVCIHAARRVVGATTPTGNLLTFWDLDSGSLLRHYELQNPRGIELTLDGNHFAVSFGAGNPPEALCLISTTTLDKVDGYAMVSTWITGSHLLSYSFPPGLRA
jgi:hypothetical protein